MDEQPSTTGGDAELTEQKPTSEPDGPNRVGGRDAVTDVGPDDPVGAVPPSLPRRGFLGAAGVVALGTVPTSGTATDDAANSDDGETDGSWVIEQDDACWPLTPLSGDETARDFYELDRDRIGDSSNPMRALQRRGKSLLFLYEDRAGDVFLVVVHGKQEATDGGEGGSATFAFHGLPDAGDWIVRDDSYEGPTRFDRWDLDGEPQVADWTWQSGWKDGAVYGPLGGGDVAVTIEPRFNDEAELFGVHYNGLVDAWQFLSGALSDPDRTALDMDEPVTIRMGECSDGQPADSVESVDDQEPTSPLRVNVACDVDEPARVRVTNAGDDPVEARDIDDAGMDVIDGRPVLDPGETMTLTGVGNGSVVLQAYEPGTESENVGPKVERIVSCPVPSPLDVSVSCDVDDAARVAVTNAGDDPVEARDIDDAGMDVIDGRPVLDPSETLTLTGVGNGRVVVQAYEPGTESENVGPKVERTVDCG